MKTDTKTLTLPTTSIDHAPGCRGENCARTCLKITTPSRYTVDAEQDGFCACPQCGTRAFWDHDSNTGGCSHCGLSFAHTSDDPAPPAVGGVLHLPVDRC